MANRDLTAHVKRIGSQDKIATGILTAIVGVVMVLVVAIIAYILIRGGMRALTPGFLTNTPTDDVLPGIVYQLWDSFYLLLVTLVISVPISLGAAIFLVEYAPDNWITSAASTAIETLSSLPSIVVGMFGSLFFVVTLGWGISIIAGACALTDAALAMGLTRWETTLNVLLPAAMPAIVTGIVISAGRVFGEAAALIFTAGSAPARLNFANPFNFMSPTCPFNIFRPACSLAVYIWRLTSEPTEGSAEIVWGTATVLIVCVLLFNLLARVLGKFLARRLTAE